MKTVCQKILGLMLTLIVSSAGFAKPSATNASDFILNYPVNVTNKPYVTLTISIPETFKAVDSMQQMLQPDNYIAEFIPKHETADNWQEIITAVRLIHKQISAERMVKFMHQQFQKQAQNVKVLETETANFPSYQKACTAMDYEYANRHEMVYMCYYSGPYDCAGVQYALLWKHTPTKKAQAQMLAKLKKYVSQNAVINWQTGSKQ